MNITMNYGTGVLCLPSAVLTKLGEAPEDAV